MTRVAICASAAVAEGEALAVNVNGHRYAVARSGGEIHVIDDRCPHAGGSLGDEGTVDAHVIECGWHEARFDLRSGAAVGGPCEHAVRAYPAQIVDGQVWIDIT